MHSKQYILTEGNQEQHQVSPDLLREVIQQLQQNTHELEIKNRELQRRNEELLQMAQQDRPNLFADDFGSKQMSLSMSDFDLIESNQKPVHNIAQNISKLHDYMVRRSERTAW